MKILKYLIYSRKGYLSAFARVRILTTVSTTHSHLKDSLGWWELPHASPLSKSRPFLWSLSSGQAATTLGLILLTDAHNKWRSSKKLTDTVQSSGYLILKCSVWFLGKELGGAPQCSGLLTGSTLAPAEQMMNHIFAFRFFFFFYESENSTSDFFQFMKIDTNVCLSSKQGGVKWTLKKQEIPVSLSLFVDKCQFLTFSTQLFFLLSAKSITGTAIFLKALFN